MTWTIGQIQSLEQLGMHGCYDYECKGAGGLRQALWLHLEGADASGTMHSITLYWLEAVDGRIWPIQLRNMDSDPPSWLPHLGGAAFGSASFAEFQVRLMRTWLFPPEVACTEIPEASVVPYMHHLHEAILRLAEFTELSITVELEGGIPLDDFDLRNELESFPLPDELALFWQLAKRFHDNLNQDILGVLKMKYAPWSEKNAGLVNYNQCISWPPLVRRNRIQALQRFSWLSGYFGLCMDYGMDISRAGAKAKAYCDELRANVVQTIDAGRKLIPVLAETYDVDKSTIRCLSRVSALGDSLPMPLHVLSWSIDAIKPDKRPTTWDELNLLDEVMKWLFWSLDLDDDRNTIRAISRQLFADGIELGFSRISRWCPSHGSYPFYSSTDFLENLAGHLPPQGLNDLRKLMGETIRLWLKMSDMQTFFEASERWHQSQIGLEDESLNRKWPGWIEKTVWFGNRCVVELTDSIQLIEEGRAMRHCVASRWESCASGHSHVFSLRSDINTRQSTLEIRVDDQYGAYIHEHRAYANAVVCRDCMESAAQLLEHVSDLAPITDQGGYQTIQGEEIEMVDAVDLPACLYPVVDTSVEPELAYPKRSQLGSRRAIEFAMASPELNALRKMLGIATYSATG